MTVGIYLLEIQLFTLNYDDLGRTKIKHKEAFAKILIRDKNRGIKIKIA